jgi:RHS repeat-associated protein
LLVLPRSRQCGVLSPAFRSKLSVTATGIYTEAIKTRTNTTNCEYDAIGNLTKDDKENISSIQWTVYGKIASITKTDGYSLAYTYDASGNRIEKIYYKGASIAAAGEQVHYTWYVRDAKGNVMAVYEKKGSAGAPRHTETHLYGSSRLGIVKELTKTPVDLDGDIYVKLLEKHTFTRGEKFFEISNHLGNVLAVVSDKKLPSAAAPGAVISFWQADVVSATGYYPFGMPMPGRSFSSGAYRYGFNGQEKSDEIKGSGNSYTAEFWEYDPRLGRRWNVDPIRKEYESPYAAFGNNPIWFTDPKGLDTTYSTGWSYWEQVDKRRSGFATIQINQRTKDVFTDTDDGNRIVNKVVEFQRVISGKGAVLGTSTIAEVNILESYSRNTKGVFERQSFDVASIEDFTSNSLYINTGLFALDVTGKRLTDQWTKYTSRSGGSFRYLNLGKGTAAPININPTSNIVGNSLKGFSFLGGGAMTFLSIGMDGYLLDQGKISTSRFTARTTANAAAFLAPFVLGSEIGGPIGLAIGAFYASGEYLYDDLRNPNGVYRTILGESIRGISNLESGLRSWIPN